MYLSRIFVNNFRNFSSLDVELDGNVVVVGENRVGKSNLLYALIFDTTRADLKALSYVYSKTVNQWRYKLYIATDCPKNA